MLLLLLAVLPAIALMVVIYICDRIEKEPIGLVLGVMGLGMLSCAPTVVCEIIAELVLSFLFGFNEWVFHFMNAFLGVALIEEFWKLVVVRLFVWNRKAFNYRFDAIVYCVASSLGFALLENVLYVFQYGFGTGVLRAVLSVPGHCTFAIFMGYFVGNAKLFEVKGQKGKSWLWLFFSLLFPTLQHGFYDFCLFTENGWLVLIFFLFVAVCDIVAIVRILRSEKQDTPFYALKQGDRWISNPEWMQMAATTLDVQMPNIQYDMTKK
ncbi:MAG: PrsW family intramembrane metalloprotease [Lachnospiraceae bacterium]|nr:PrsW family intramembrane metalloprotease [Lachnospiraceae bacterium]